VCAWRLPRVKRYGTCSVPYTPRVACRTKGVTQFEFVKHKRGQEEDASMCVCICVSGWLRDDESDFTIPW
jgi:hypothetical protein